jgi:hypothetical protein
MLCICEQFVADGVFFAELNEVLTRELAEDGYSGVEVRVTPMRTEIIIRATRTQNVLGTSRVLVCLLFNFLLLLLFFIFYFLNIEKRCKGKIRSL